MNRHSLNKHRHGSPQQISSNSTFAPPRGEMQVLILQGCRPIWKDPSRYRGGSMVGGRTVRARCCGLLGLGGCFWWQAGRPLQAVTDGEAKTF